MFEVVSFVKRHAPEVVLPTVAYSVLFGGYDKPPPALEHAEIDYILFTDHAQSVPPPWRVIRVDPMKFGPRRTGRYFKCLGHHLFPFANKSVYFDASFAPLKPLEHLFSDHDSVRFGLFNHRNHCDISDEAVACTQQGKDNADILKHQVARYRDEGLPHPSGCFATGVLLRDLTNPAVAAVNEAWCAEILVGSVRDQISLPYVFWKNDFRPDFIKGDVFYNNYLVPRPHVGASLQMRVKRAAALQLYRFGVLKR